MITITINVTADLIASGKPGQCGYCPVALGCIAAGLSNVEVFDDRVDYQYDSNRLPEIARSFIRNFDYDKPVHPISFPLEVPEEALS